MLGLTTSSIAGIAVGAVILCGVVATLAAGLLFVALVRRRKSVQRQTVNSVQLQAMNYTHSSHSGGMTVQNSAVEKRDRCITRRVSIIYCYVISIIIQGF